MSARSIIAAVFTVLLAAGSASAQGKHEGPAKAWAEKNLKTWMADPVVQNEIKAQNVRHAGLTQADIDRMDNAWIAEVKTSTRPTVDKVNANPASPILKKLQADSKGLITEFFIMDNRGLNVAQSNPTSDYWQGDEAKWQKTYLVGPATVFVDSVNRDESTQLFQTQVSMTVVDDKGAAIGAVTVGLNVELLLQ